MKGIGPAQKMIFGILFLVFIFGFLGIIYWVREPDYGLLYGGLGQKEAAEIVAYLKDNDIPYKVGDKGTSVMVPPGKIHEARMDLAKNNLPRGDIGFELFDEVKFGMSNLAQKVNYRRAIQGELSKTISQLEGVEWARVQIVIPEPSLFVDEELPSTASIIIKTKGRKRLKPAQVEGITHLVSASIEGLTTENVTITDSLGNLLSKSEDSTFDGMVSNQLEYKKKIEDYHAAKALNILEKITGMGKAIVKVSADLDFMNVDEKQTIYDQENRVPTSQTIQSLLNETPQLFKGTEEEDGKVKIHSEIRNIKEAEETETTQYAISKTERAVSNHVAKIKRLTVAVLVDGTYEEEETEDGEKVRKYVSRPQEEMDQIASIVKQSMGIDETPPRNDKFEIQNMQFQELAPVSIDEKLIKEEKKKEFMLKIAKNSSLVIAVLAFLLFALKTLKKLSGPQQVGYATYEAPQALEEKLDLGLETDIDKKRRQVVDKKRVEIRDDILTETKGDPRTTSNLIRKWLREGEQ